MYEIDDTDEIRDVLNEMLNESSEYNSQDQIDDHVRYDACIEGAQEYDHIFGSLIIAMNPIGDSVIVEAKEKRDDDGYYVQRVDN